MRTCTSANIPLGKTDDPAVREFLTGEVKNGGSIPGSHQLREAYLPDVYNVAKNKLKELLRNQKIAVIFDEMSDAEGRFVLNILYAPLQKNAEGRVVPYLATTEFLKVTNHTTVSQAVVKSLQDYEIPFNNVVVIDTDNAAYCKKAFVAVLQGLCPFAVHITCMAHIMNLIGESFRAPFKDVNAFVRAFSQMFFMAEAVKHVICNFLRLSYNAQII